MVAAPSVTLPPYHLRCKLPGCNRRRFQEPDGKTHEFCGRTHVQEYAKIHQSSSEGFAFPFLYNIIMPYPNALFPICFKVDILIQGINVVFHGAPDTDMWTQLTAECMTIVAEHMPMRLRERVSYVLS